MRWDPTKLGVLAYGAGKPTGRRAGLLGAARNILTSSPMTSAMHVVEMAIMSGL